MLRWNLSRIAKASAAVERSVGELVERTAFAIEAAAKQAAPVDTGHLRASIGAARSGPLSATVTVGAHYGIYVELGTRYMRARPYLKPAAQGAAARVRAAGITVTLGGAP